MMHYLRKPPGQKMNIFEKPTAPKTGFMGRILNSEAVVFIVVFCIIVGASFFIPGYTLIFGLFMAIFINATFLRQNYNIAGSGPFYCKLPDLPDGSSAWQTCSWRTFTKKTMPPPPLKLRSGFDSFTLMMLILAVETYIKNKEHFIWPFVAVLVFIGLNIAAKRQIIMVSQFEMARMVSGRTQGWVQEQVEAGKATPLPTERGGRIFFSLPPKA
jgi:hypothetical protein